MRASRQHRLHDLRQRLHATSRGVQEEYSAAQDWNTACERTVIQQVRMQVSSGQASCAIQSNSEVRLLISAGLMAASAS